jgi:Flp pilus assembly pilin Flp
MSDFLSTTRVNAGLALETVVKQVRRFRHDAGQTAAEYMGVLLVVSVIIAAVATTGIGTDIKTKMADLVTSIGKGEDAKKAGAAEKKEDGDG